MSLESSIEPSAQPPTERQRKRSANRLKYEAEIRVIRAKIGGLEEIRSRLGLSRRKICQLLLVDPSAWTRWTSPEGEAPPHIYRALEWYLMLTEKDARALMPIGSWSSTAFEQRFQSLENQLAKLNRYGNKGILLRTPYGPIGVALGLAVAIGIAIMLFFH